MNIVITSVIFIGLRLPVISSFSEYIYYNRLPSVLSRFPFNNQRPLESFYLEHSSPQKRSISNSYYLNRFQEQLVKPNIHYEEYTPTYFNSGNNNNGYQENKLSQTGFEKELEWPIQELNTLPEQDIAPMKKSCTSWTSPEGIRFTLSQQSGNAIHGSHFSKNNENTDCDTFNNVKSNYFSPPYYSPGSASDFVNI